MKAAPPLAERARAPGFTPALRDVDGLVTLLGAPDDEAVRDAERALLRLGGAALPPLLKRFEGAAAPLRARLLKVIARAGAGDPAVVDLCLAALADADPKTRRTAAAALGKVADARVEGALLGAWAREERVDHRRTLAEALGKVGGADALAALKKAVTDDAELERLRRRAVLMLERTLAREAPTTLDAAIAPEAPAALTFRCRNGVERILAEELGPDLAPRVRGPGVVTATLRGPLRTVFRARTFVDFGFTLPPEPRAEGESLEDVVVRVLTSQGALSLLRRFTVGPLRFRLEWAGGGPRRALVWRCSDRVRAACPELINDPTRSPWEVVVRELSRRGGGVAANERHAVAVELVPRAVDDPRFRYRVTDVPAASHPTLAAALARVAGARADDVVWDPFVGSGTELIERARLGPWAELIGSDLDPAALDAARANLAAAGVAATLSAADATAFAPEGVTLVLTNPPMGRRVVHHAELAGLLDRFVDHVARVLRPGGRLVWLSPKGDRTAERARARGMTVDTRLVVDMGGFDAELQVCTQPAAKTGGGERTGAPRAPTPRAPRR